MKKFIVNLKDLRKSRDLTQKELAENLGVSRQSIIAVEAGKFLPSIELAWQIANFFDCTIDQLLNPFDEVENQILGKEANMRRDLIEWDPTREINTFRGAMDRLVDDFFGEDYMRKGVYLPSIDVNIDDNIMNIKCEVPGIDPDNVNITIEDNMLTIEGERKSETEEEKKNWYRKEIKYGKFSRTVSLPQPIVSDKATAKFKNGMIIITAPLLEESKTKGKKIKVETED